MEAALGASIGELKPIKKLGGEQKNSKTEQTGRKPNETPHNSKNFVVPIFCYGNDLSFNSVFFTKKKKGETEMNAGCLSFIDFRAVGKCRYYKNCKYKSEDSYECNHKGSNYCGIYRTHKDLI